ncbi:LOW QUALITY PROTEIN: transcription initiation factor TFIID subunit 7-like [Sarcophilus harrisii]
MSVYLKVATSCYPSKFIAWFEACQPRLAHLPRRFAVDVATAYVQLLRGTGWTRELIQGLLVDKKIFYKTADVCQMLVCSVDGDLYPPPEEPVATTDLKASKKKDKDRERKFIWNHGITMPLKNVRKRKFRKTAKKYIESPDVEKEVKRLLSTDAEAVSARWEVIAEDETKEIDNQVSLAGLDISSPGMSGHKQGHSSSEHDELREIFNDISSSSEEEEETHDDEDINIIDTEEDLERQLQDKLDESDEQRQENEETNQMVVGIQKQIDIMKGKLQETQVRAKRQDLIIKVENSSIHLLFPLIELH